MTERISSIAAWIAWTGFIVLLVFPWDDVQNHMHLEKMQWIPFVTPPVKTRDIVANVLVYIPFGYLGCRSLGKRRGKEWTCALAASLSALTEIAQLFSHYRFPSTSDWTCNLIGTTIGLALCVWAWRRPSPMILEMTQ